MDDYREKTLAALDVKAKVEWDGHGPAVVTIDIAELDRLIGLAEFEGDIDAACEDHYERGRNRGYSSAVADIESLAVKVADVPTGDKL